MHSDRSGLTHRPSRVCLFKTPHQLNRKCADGGALYADEHGRIDRFQLDGDTTPTPKSPNYKRITQGVTQSVRRIHQLHLLQAFKAKHFTSKQIRENPYARCPPSAQG